MTAKARLTKAHQDLVRRYLLWAYKSTRESFERIERKTTQLMVDEHILDHLKRGGGKVPAEFKSYIANKRKEELKLKYTDARKQGFHPGYVYLKQRLAAIESAVGHFLGKGELKRMARQYEEEFTRRILEARDH